MVCVRLNAANGSFSALLEFKRQSALLDCGVRSAECELQLEYEELHLGTGAGTTGWSVRELETVGGQKASQTKLSL